MIGIGLSLYPRATGSGPAEPATLFAGSAQFPLENGLSTDPADTGEFRLTGSRTAMTGAGANAFWSGAASIVAIVDPARDFADGLRSLPMIISTHAGATSPRIVCLGYFSGDAVTVNNRNKFYLIIRGETGASERWDIFSPQLPADARGPFAVYVHNDGANGYCHVLDIQTGIWYDGTASAKPSGFVGAPQISYDFALGGAGDYTWPRAVANQQNSPQWRGAIGDILFANAALSKADVEAIVAGGDPVSVATTAGATKYLHVDPGAQAIATSYSGITLEQKGTIHAGPTLRRQATGAYLTLDPLHWPAHFGRLAGASQSFGVLSGKTGGLTGPMEYAIAGRDGSSIKGWSALTVTYDGADWSAPISIPIVDQQFQLLVRRGGVVAASHSAVQAGPVIAIWGQSEMDFSLIHGWNTQGAPTTLNPVATGATDTVLWATKKTLPVYHIRFAKVAPGLVGDPAIAVANAIRAVTDEPVMLVDHAISGSSMLDLMRDDQSGRTWEDVEARQALTQNRGPDGEYILSGDVWGGWEAVLGWVDPIDEAYRPWRTGQGSSLITTGQIDHWRGDGTFTDARQVVLPCNRAWATAADPDGFPVEADQRDAFRNWGHELGYIVGPDQTTHRMEGETAAEALGDPPGGTHPEPNVWEGCSEMAWSNGQAILMAMGYDVYKGPIFFESIRAGSAADKVIVKLGPHRPTPGDGLVNKFGGHFVGAQGNTAPFTDSLYTKKSGGDPGSGWEAKIDGGAWSKANVVSGTIVSDDEIELTLASAYSTVALRYLPGTPGGYPVATITQEAWRSGLLHYGGTGYDAGHPEKTGFAVSGSNQELVL